MHIALAYAYNYAFNISNKAKFDYTVTGRSTDAKVGTLCVRTRPNDEFALRFKLRALKGGKDAKAVDAMFLHPVKGIGFVTIDAIPKSDTMSFLGRLGDADTATAIEAMEKGKHGAIFSDVEWMGWSELEKDEELRGDLAALKLPDEFCVCNSPLAQVRLQTVLWLATGSLC